MNILAVDDEEGALHNLETNIHDAQPTADVKAFNSAIAALEEAKNQLLRANSSQKGELS
jgi:hypothetical protein